MLILSAYTVCFKLTVAFGVCAFVCCLWHYLFNFRYCLLFALFTLFWLLWIGWVWFGWVVGFVGDVWVDGCGCVGLCLNFVFYFDLIVLIVGDFGVWICLLLQGCVKRNFSVWKLGFLNAKFGFSGCGFGIF